MQVVQGDGAVGTLETYEGNPTSNYVPDQIEEQTIQDVLNRVKIIEDELYELHGLWYQISLFKHGLQYTIYSYVDGFPYYQAEVPDGMVRAVYNVMAPVQNQTRAYFLESPPRYTTRAVTEDGEDIEKAKAAAQVAAYFEREVNLRQIRAECADWMTTHGTGVVFCGWDPLAGGIYPTVGPNGPELRRTGKWLCEVVPTYQLVNDPEARNGMTDSRFVIRRRRIARDWVVRNFEHMSQHVTERSLPGEIASTYELAFLTLSARHGFTSRSEGTMPAGRNMVFIYEMWEKPSPYYPKGRYVIMTDDHVLLYMGENPYGDDLPFVTFPFIRVEGSFWARSSLMDVMYLQLEINRRESQKSEHCNLLGNPPLFHWVGDGLDEDNVSNVVGNIYGLNPYMGPGFQPFFLKPPELSMTVREMVPEAMRFVDFISGHFGPSRGEIYSQVKSGVQQMMLEEADARNMKPYMEDWENGWQQVYRLALKHWQKFAVLPHKVKVLGQNGQWRLRHLNRDAIDDTADIEIVPGSTLPASGSTRFTKMLALLQAGAFNLMDPVDNQRFWEAIDMQDMIRFMSDKKSDREKALRELELIRSGQRAYIDPIADDPNIHLDVINTFIRSPEFEQADPAVKALAILHRQDHIIVLQAAFRVPGADGFPIYGEGGAASGGPVGPGVGAVGTGNDTGLGPNVGMNATSRGDVNLESS